MSTPIRSMIFVDGENLVFRFQEMEAKGSKRLPGTAHTKDVFAWNASIVTAFIFDPIRVAYYTSMVGDEDKIATQTTGIAGHHLPEMGSPPTLWVNMYGRGNLVPFVAKKPKQEEKSRLVDLRIAIDVMRAAYTDAVDAICVISGDGDFIELYQDVMRRGKKVCVGALSSGLNPRVPSCVDDFICLDRYIFEPNS